MTIFLLDLNEHFAIVNLTNSVPSMEKLNPLLSPFKTLRDTKIYYVSYILLSLVLANTECSPWQAPPCYQCERHGGCGAGARALARERAGCDNEHCWGPVVSVGSHRKGDACNPNANDMTSPNAKEWQKKYSNFQKHIVYKKKSLRQEIYLIKSNPLVRNNVLVQIVR